MAAHQNKINAAFAFGRAVLCTPRR